MNCNAMRQHWMLYLDSEGDPEMHLRVRNHLADCRACAQWLGYRQRLDQAVLDQLGQGPQTADLWARVLCRAHLVKPRVRSKPWTLLGGALAAAVVLQALGLWIFQFRQQGPLAELSRNAVAWHEQWLQGGVQPELVSPSDQEIERYLKKRVPFQVHCPPRTDVDFAVQGAGVCSLKDRRQAAYIVGRVGQAPVSILVFPQEQLGIKQGRHRGRQRDFQTISDVVGDNVVVVIGAAAPEALEKLLDAYGTYHEG